jgi:uncharacterized protein
MSIIEAVPQAISATPAPIAAPKSERLGALDLARGIALLMILPINMAHFSGMIDPWTGARQVKASLIDHLIKAVTLVFVEGKCITLLSILFGAGLALQIWQAQGRPFTGYYLKRMGILFCIGFSHALFLWYGDILTAYAIVAVAALFASKLPPRGMAAVIAGCLLWFILCAVGMAISYSALGGGIPSPNPTPESAGADWSARISTWFSTENQSRIFREGPIWEIMAARLALLFFGQVFSFWLIYGWYLLACFLIGVWLLRRGIFHDFATHRRFVLYGLLGAFGVGLPLELLALIVYVFKPDGSLAGFVGMLGALPMALGYLGLILFWSHSGMLSWLQTSLQAVGRTALSNYILQSIVCNILFYSYGLRLFGKVGELGAFGIVLAIWLVEITVSLVWLRFFQIGPIEWLWRSLADGHLRPLLRAT